MIIVSSPGHLAPHEELKSESKETGYLSVRIKSKTEIAYDMVIDTRGNCAGSTAHTTVRKPREMYYSYRTSGVSSIKQERQSSEETSEAT